MKDATKDKIREYALKNAKGACSEEYRVKTHLPKTQVRLCKECLKWFKNSTWKQTICSPECRKKINSHNGGFKENSTRVTKQFYKSFKMDSKAEVEFAKLLDKHNIKWLKNQGETYFTFENLGKTHKYYPDFFLPEYNIWVEIKGKFYLRPDDEIRWASCPNLQVIWSKYIKLPRLV